MTSSPALDWDDLRYFLAAARARSLAGAARALGVEHTTVGRRIAALERALGASLMVRGADGLSLTRLGERITPELEQVERSVRALTELARSAASHVRLAVPSGFTHFFTARLAELAREHPGLSLEIVSGARQVDLTRGEADLAVRSAPLEDPDLIARKLGEAGFSLYASEVYLASHPLPDDLEDLRGQQLIGFHESLRSVPAARWVEQHASGASIVLRSLEMTDMLTAAVDGVGIAVLPCALAELEPRLRRLTPEIVASRPLWLVHRREARNAKELRAVVQFVTTVIKQNAVTIHGIASKL